MNIKNCLDQGLTEMHALTEYFMMKVFARGEVEYITPSNVRVDSIRIPMTQNNVSFTYKSTRQIENTTLGTFKFDVYYPVGSIVNLCGKECRITSYGNPIKNIFGNGVYYVDVTVEYVSEVPAGRINNDVIEGNVLAALTDIIYKNETIKQMLGDYNHNIIDLMGSGVEDIEKSVDESERLRQMEKKIAHYYMLQMAGDVDGNDVGTLRTDFVAFNRYHTAPTLYVNHGPVITNVNSMAFVSWLLSSPILEDETYVDNRTYLPLLTEAPGSDRFYAVDEELPMGCDNVRWEIYNIPESEKKIVYLKLNGNYNLAIVIDAWNPVTANGRANPSFSGFAVSKYRGDENTETTTIVKRLPADHSRSTWEQLANLFARLVTIQEGENDVITHYENIITWLSQGETVETLNITYPAESAIENNVTVEIEGVTVTLKN